MNGNHDSDHNRRQYLPAPVYFLLILALLIAAVGCYWTPDSKDDGDIAVKITLPASGGSSPGVESLENGPEVFLYVFVLDESVMKATPSQAALIHSQIAFGDVTYAIEQAIEANDYSLEAAAEDFSMSVELTAGIFQQRTIAATTASGAAEPFTGLPADQEFLVGVYGVEHAGEGFFYLYLGFGTVSIVAGQNSLVEITLSEDPIPFFDYIIENYGLARLELDASGLSSWNNLTSPLYYDLLSTIATGGSFTTLSNQNPEAFDAWYQSESVTTVDVGRNSQGKSGSRRPLRPEFNNQYHLVGVLPNDSWNILLTEWESRDNAVSFGRASTRKNFFSAEAGGTVSLVSYDGATHYDNVQLSD